MAEYHVENFGCRSSQADGAAIATGLEQLGLSAAAGFPLADVVILNTCSVTAEADRETRAFVRKVRRANPNAQVLVTGCYAQRAPEEIAALPGVDRVVGNSHKALVARIAAGMAAESPSAHGNLVPVSALKSANPLVDDTFAHAELALISPGGEVGRHVTRPNLKVQDGCGNRCSFCVIPQTRGGSRSVALDGILESVRNFVAGGGQELVLSGINLGRWGRDLAQPRRFDELVAAILTETELPRLRISSVEPMDWTERLLDLFLAFAQCEHPRLARHAHLPLQSGSDAILRAMYRRYRPWHYASKLEQIKKIVPDAAIGADVMVGFPGETDPLFAETFRFIEQQPFTYLHLFPFSARPGTAASALYQQTPVPGEAVKERMAALRALIDAKHKAFRERFVGRALSVVTLKSGKDASRTAAMADNFLSVTVAGEFAANLLLRVRITGLSESGLYGEEVAAGCPG